jgi:hypothetical protein
LTVQTNQVCLDNDDIYWLRLRRAHFPTSLLVTPQVFNRESCLHQLNQPRAVAEILELVGREEKLLAEKRV